jgi:hypothetical protein
MTEKALLERRSGNADFGGFFPPFKKNRPLSEEGFTRSVSENI